MYKMKSPSDRNPPLAETPNRLPGRILRSSNNISIQTPQASYMKTQVPDRSWSLEESQLRPEYRTISCEIRALAKMVENEFENRDLPSTAFATKTSTLSSTNSLFERGRFYDEYSAKRNERLKKRKGETGDVRRSAYNLGVTVESGKKRDTKKFESLRKSVPATLSTAGGTENGRYYLRSSNKIKKPPLPRNSERSVIDEDRKIGARRVKKS